MFKFSKTKASVIFGIFIICILIYSDLVPVQKAHHDMLMSMPVAKVEELKEQTNADMDRVITCIRSHKAIEESEMPDKSIAFRTCLLDFLPQIKTPTGAIAMAKAASLWLTTHPSDDAIRTAAIITVQNGRAELLKQKSWYYDSLDKLAKAEHDSIILRHFNGRQDILGSYNSRSMELEQAEQKMKSAGQNSLDVTPIAGGFSMALVDAQYTASCKKRPSQNGDEKVSNKDECLEMLNKLEAAITSEEGCRNGVTCKPLIDHIHELKKI